MRHDPLLEVLEQRGRSHEADYLAHLRVAGVDVLEFTGDASDEGAVQHTRKAMGEGAPAIAQATLQDGRWYGRADLLRRVERPSALGPWSYEVIDTKLASETRAGTVLQLCLYSDLVSGIQGLVPEAMYVVSPGRFAAPERLRTHDFLAAYRWIRAQLEQALVADAEATLPTYPEPVPHCDVCSWWPRCDRQRRTDDHLSLVAGLTRLQRRELGTRGIASLVELARVPFPLDPPPRRGSPEADARGRAQAQIQLASRGQPCPRWQRIEPILPGEGLARLPEPSPGDVFLDLEGDPFVEGGGREYLFGWIELTDNGAPVYTRHWALDQASEREAFRALVMHLAARLQQHPDLHIYHFAPYEPAALRRLMGRHAVAEEELDRLLRGQRFVVCTRWFDRACASASSTTRSSTWNRCTSSGASSTCATPRCICGPWSVLSSSARSRRSPKRVAAP